MSRRQPLGVLSPRVQPEEKPAQLDWRLVVGIAGVVLAAMLSSLDQRLSTAGVADLLGGLGLGRDEGSWISTSYTIGDIAIVPFTPWLAQLVSPRRLVAAEIVLFVVAAAACPIAGTYHGLIALRFLQGFGEGGLVPLLLLTLLRLTPPRHRPEGFAVYAVVSTLVPLVSEPLAGVATDLLTWQTLFWFSALLGPVCLFMVLGFLPVEPVRWKAFAEADYFSMASLVVFCSTLVTALGQGQRLDWFDDRLIVALFTAAGFSFAAFLIGEWTSAKPLLDLSLFRRGNFSIGLLLVTVFNIGLLGATFVEPQTQMILRSLKPLQIGALFLLLAIPQLLVAPLAAALMRILDARILVAMGFGMGCLGAYLCAYATPDWAAQDFVVPLALQASGWPLAFVPLVFLTTSVLKPEDALTGGTIFNIVRTLAIAGGPALIEAIITVRERVHSVYITSHIVAGTQAVDARLLPGGPQSLIAASRAQAYVLSYADAFGVISLVLLAGLVLVLFQSEAPIIRRQR